MERKTAYGDKIEPEGPKNTGRMGFRWPEEPPDERPTIDQAPFWKSQSERLTYEHAVATNPKRPGEGSFTYIARIAAIAQGRLSKPKSDAGAINAAVKPMPDPPEDHTDGERNRRSQELLRQLEGR